MEVCFDSKKNNVSPILEISFHSKKKICPQNCSCFVFSGNWDEKIDWSLQAGQLEIPIIFAPQAFLNVSKGTEHTGSKREGKKDLPDNITNDLYFESDVEA